MFDYYQSLLPKADISKSFLKNHYKRARFNSDENINNNDNTKNLVLKNSIKFFYQEQKREKNNRITCIRPAAYRMRKAGDGADG